MDKRTAEFKDRKTAYSVTAGGTYNFGVVTAMGIYQYLGNLKCILSMLFGLSRICSFSRYGQTGCPLFMGKNSMACQKCFKGP